MRRESGSAEWVTHTTRTRCKRVMMKDKQIMEGDLSYDKMLYTFSLDLFLCFSRFYVIMFVCLGKKRKRKLSLFFSAYVFVTFGCFIYFVLFFSTGPVI